MGLSVFRRIAEVVLHVSRGIRESAWGLVQGIEIDKTAPMRAGWVGLALTLSECDRFFAVYSVGYAMAGVDHIR